MGPCPHAPARYPSLVDDLPLTHAALEFAAARHDGQRREADHAPFILHPLEVAQLLRGRGLRDEVIAELRDRFGPEVARLVGAVTEPAADGSLARAPRSEPDPEKLEHYWASLSLLEERLRGHPLVQQLRFELETLELLPPRPDRG